jgi:hypothetical protein
MRSDQVHLASYSEGGVVVTKHIEDFRSIMVRQRLLRNAAPFLVLVAFASLPTPLCSQTIKIKIVNGRNGRSIAGTHVNVWLGKERIWAMVIPTNKNGIASLVLTNNEGEVNVPRVDDHGSHVVDNPVVKYDDDIGINVPFVLCQAGTPDYSWLAVRHVPTKQVVRDGIVMPNTCGKATAAVQPGEVVIFARPLTWWEKLKQ